MSAPEKDCPRRKEDEALTVWAYYADTAANLLRDHPAIPSLQENGYRHPSDVLKEAAEGCRRLRDWLGVNPDGGITQRHERIAVKRVLTGTNNAQSATGE